MFKMHKMKHVPLGVVIAVSAFAGSTEGQPGDHAQAGGDPLSACVEAKNRLGDFAIVKLLAP